MNPLAGSLGKKNEGLWVQRVERGDVSKRFLVWEKNMTANVTVLVSKIQKYKYPS